MLKILTFIHSLKSRSIHVLIFIFLALTTSQCLEPFHASVSSSSTRLLVVEGYINAGPGPTVIRLSRTTPLEESQDIVRETNAIVTIHSNENEVYTLTESEEGVYTSGELNLPSDKSYSLDIKLEDGKEYQSPSLPVRVTTPIDSISWEWNRGVDIFVNTHTFESNERQYYQWEFAEDWEIHAQRWSDLKFEDDTVKPRSPEESYMMYVCWMSSKSMGLILGSTDDRVNNNTKFQLKRIGVGAWETSVRYSILVTQRSLSVEEYNYLKLMEKNSTQMGSFFDPMPSEIYGNIHNVEDPEEMVVGYIGAYTTEKQRIFINNSELPNIPINFKCDKKEIKMMDKDTIQEYIVRQHYIPITSYLDLHNYAWMTAMPNQCLDCRLYGTNVKPDFW